MVDDPELYGGIDFLSGIQWGVGIAEANIIHDSFYNLKATVVTRL